jgi:hypothetical protein
MCTSNLKHIKTKVGNVFVSQKGMPKGQFSLMDNNNFPPTLYDKYYKSWKFFC